MAVSSYKNIAYSTAEYTRLYRSFSGVELSEGELTSDTSRLAYSKNMYKDYEADGDGVLETVPGYRILCQTGENANGLYYQAGTDSSGDALLIHTAGNLRRIPIDGEIGMTESATDVIAELNDARSTGVAFGNNFYILDGEKITRVDSDGGCSTVSDSGAAPYVPTTYISGVEHEQRNLLTNKFNELHVVTDPALYLTATDSLKYIITDYEKRYCSVYGIDSSFSGDVYVPSYVTLSGILYKVTAIEPKAFMGNTSITAMVVGEGVKSIGYLAFYKCTDILYAVLPDSLTVIGNGAFGDCTRVEDIYLGKGIEELGNAVFSSCTSLNYVYYPLDSESYYKITNAECVTEDFLMFETSYDDIRLTIPIYSDAKSVSKVYVNGSAVKYTSYKFNGRVLWLMIKFSSMADAVGITITVTGVLNEYLSDFSGDDGERTQVNGMDAVNQCTVAEAFDSRIFLSGNPQLPNTVFYTSAAGGQAGSPLYVGVYNYFNDGIGSYKVCSMLAVRDKLAVFKEGDDGTGSIFYHKRKDTDSDLVPAIYPVEYVHSGICSLGASHSFMDDPVFLTADGLCALKRENIDYQRSVVCRSNNIGSSLLAEDLSRASLSDWLGYLAVGVNGRIFLADSRSGFIGKNGEREYEWFTIEGVGGYTDDETVYRYASEAYGDHEIKAGHESEAVAISVSSITDEDGVIHYYTEEDGSCYAVIRTEEKQGGTFCPATVFASHGRLLFFATELGHIGIFNNDKRGVPPEYISEDEDYDADGYTAAMNRRIHPYFYSFARHAIPCEIRTALDDCGIPHLTKSTVKKSLTVKAKSTASDGITAYVRTDRNDPTLIASFPSDAMDFTDFSFEVSPWRVSPYVTSALPEGAKRWVEKQIILKSEKYASPIWIYSIAYRYTVKGKIKNNG